MSSKTLGRVFAIAILVLTAIIITAILFVDSTKAQSKQEIAPYQFAEFSVSQQLTDGQVYKAVHEGCELYIAVVGKNGQSPSVSITTGRGCK